MNLIQKASKAFLEKTPADKTGIGQHVIDGISAAPATTFPRLPYTVAAMQTANDKLVASNAKVLSGSHSDVAAHHADVKAWNQIWSKTADYVSFEAAGNAEIIRLAGFEPTSGESKPKQLPGQAQLKKMVNHDGGVAGIEMQHPGAGVAAAYMYLAIPDDAQLSTAADGTATVTFANGQKLYAKCDTHNATTMGGMEANKPLKLVVQPVNNVGAGGASAPKGFTPQP